MSIVRDGEGFNDAALRAFIAAAALHALTPVSGPSVESKAATAVKLADALMAELAKR